jgi:hypothetical protein
MSVLSCTAGAWLPFADPAVEEESQLKLLISRIETEIRRSTVPLPTEWEKEKRNLLRILRRSEHEIEKALLLWIEWVEWRHNLKIDEITEEDIKNEKFAKLAYWKGKDKQVGNRIVIGI